MRHQFRLAVGALALAVACLGLTSCETGFFAGPISLQDSPTGLRVTLCESAQVTRIVAKERQKGIFGRWVTFWEISGEARVESGATFTLGAGSHGLTESVNETPSLDPGSELSVTFFDANRVAVADAVFTIGAEGVPTDLWQQANGKITKNPCLAPTNSK